MPTYPHPTVTPAKGRVPDEVRRAKQGDGNQGGHYMALTQDQRRKAIELHAAGGMSYRRIAREVGCSCDGTIRAMFVPKKPKPIPTTPRKMPAKQKFPVTKSVLVYHVRTSSTSVPMRCRHYFPPLDHIPTRNELLAMLHDAVVRSR
jgi:hypothetical protein